MDGMWELAVDVVLTSWATSIDSMEERTAGTRNLASLDSYCAQKAVLLAATYLSAADC